MKPKPTSTAAKGKKTKNLPAHKTAHKTAVEIPAILLEGDHPSPPPVSGPGEKFALGPTPPQQQFEIDAELPAAYGTGQLFLMARDPHWLYANWDLTRAQQLRYNQQSADGHLILRVFVGDAGGQAISEIHVHPESRHWFVPAERAATQYVAELGYYRPGKIWQTVATSGRTLTPPDTTSADTRPAFATIPVEVPFEELVSVVKQAGRENLPLAQALEELRKSGHPEIPFPTAEAVSEWTPAQEHALAQVINGGQERRVWIGSLEISELIRPELEPKIPSISEAQLDWPTSQAGAGSDVSESSVSSPFGGRPPRERGFWFNVNAELIIYGATECDASVTIGGRKIKLRADGSFSYRFALPDGHFDLPVVAVSSDETDGRTAELRFSRTTESVGEVGAHLQDPALMPPLAENV